jgi:hypothetical protein
MHLEQTIYIFALPTISITDDFVVARASAFHLWEIVGSILAVDSAGLLCEDLHNAQPKIRVVVA